MLAHALESAGECVSITDVEDRILFVNEAFLRTYGYAEGELIGRPIGIVRAERTPADVQHEILPATLDGAWHGELWNRARDGREFPISLATSTVPLCSSMIRLTVAMPRPVPLALPWLKNGSKMRFWIFFGMPLPLSLTWISTPPSAAGFQVRVTLPPSRPARASRALPSRFSITRLNRCRSRLARPCILRHRLAEDHEKRAIGSKFQEQRRPPARLFKCFCRAGLAGDWVPQLGTFAADTEGALGLLSIFGATLTTADSLARKPAHLMGLHPSGGEAVRQFVCDESSDVQNTLQQWATAVHAATGIPRESTEAIARWIGDDKLDLSELRHGGGVQAGADPVAHFLDQNWDGGNNCGVHVSTNRQTILRLDCQDERLFRGGQAKMPRHRQRLEQSDVMWGYSRNRSQIGVAKLIDRSRRSRARHHRVHDNQAIDIQYVIEQVKTCL